MGHAVFFQEIAQFLRLGDRGGADENGPPRGVDLVHRLGHRPVLGPLRLEDEIRFVHTDHRLIRRHYNDRQLVDLEELVFLRLGRAGHARQFFVHAEIILEGDGGQSLGFPLDLHAFLGFDGLMKPVGIAAAVHQAAGKFVHDNDFVALHHIIPISVHDGFRPKSRVKAVGILDIFRGVEILHPQHRLDLMHRLVAGGHRLLLLINGIILPRLQSGHRLRHPGVNLGGFRPGPGNDEGRPRLVDQNAVHLVHDGEMKRPLHHLLGRNHHVVPQIVKAVFIVRAEGHVAAVIELARREIHVMFNKAHGKAQKFIQMSHPFAVAPGQIFIHRHHVNAFAGESVKVYRQRRHQRLPFPRLHLGDLSLVKAHAADELHVEVAHPQDPPRCLPTDCEGLGQNIVQGLPRRQPLLKLLRIAGQRGVADLLEPRFQAVDLIHGKLHPLDLFIVIVS